MIEIIPTLNNASVTAVQALELDGYIGGVSPWSVALIVLVAVAMIGVILLFRLMLGDEND